MAAEGRRLAGVVLNVGAGEDLRTFGSRTVRLDRHAPAATVRADIAATLPFVDRAFDAAVCTEVLEHVPSPALVLREIARVVKPGAVLLVTMPFFFHYHPDPEDYSRLTPTGLQLELERAGFRVEFIAGLGGRFIAAAMLAESTHSLSKLIVRTMLLPFRVLLASRRPVDGRWSDCAANIVAIARARTDADR